jgi:hypothetical protein
VERLQVVLVLPAVDLVVAALVAEVLMVHQVIVVPEPMVLPTGDLAETQALTAETRVMTDHPAMETVGPPVVATAVVMAAGMVVVTVAGMVVVTVVATAVATATAAAMATVVVTATAAATAAEANRSYQKETVTVHGFKGSGVQRLHSHHHTSFCKRFVRENRPLPHSYNYGTWYLAFMWQNQHFLRGLRVFNFVPVPNPER